MYIPVFWKDRVVQYPRRVSITNLGNGIQEWTPAPGEIIERGTQQSATHFGNMDFGVLENALMAAFTAMNLRLVQDSIDDIQGQVLTVALNNTRKFPATNAEKTVTLPKTVNNVDYDITAEIVEADGPVECVEVYGKQCHFKITCNRGASLMAANVIIKTDERRAQEAEMLRHFGGGSPRNSERENREYAEEINARMNEVKREVGIRI